MHTETQQAAQWWALSRGKATADWVRNYQKSVQARHRGLIAQVVKDLQPETLLEVGCHCGPNLMRFAQDLPNLRMIGIDISAEAIAAGRQWVAHEGRASRIQLNAGRIPDALERLPSGSIDVVLSCYTLGYIAPADLDAVLYEMGRIAAHAVVLAEPMTSGPAEVMRNRQMYGYNEWAHDYAAASQWIGTMQHRTIRMVPIDPPVDRLNGICIAVS